MTKHIIDRKRDGSNVGRTKAYVSLDRMGNPHPASRELMRRSEERTGAGHRVKEFLRIERGHTA